MTTTYNRFDPAKNYDRHLFRADKVLQSAEFNELQSNLMHRIQGVADVLLSEGQIIRDAGININSQTGEVSLQSGAVYLAGAVRGVKPAQFIIPLTGTVVIGFYLSEIHITELEDPALLNPAAGTRGYMEAGAARLQRIPSWGISGIEGVEFYAVYTIVDGQLFTNEAPPTLDAFSQTLARYDRDSTNSNYVVNGMRVTQLANLNTGEQVYSIGEGRARVNGYGVTLGTSRRAVYNAVPVQRYITSEPHQSSSAGAQRISLDRVPVAQVIDVKIETHTTLTLNHATYAGALDPIGVTSVVAIESVTQGGTTYVQGTDYKLTAGQVDWSLSGSEPAPGASYSVVVRHIVVAEPTDIDSSGFTVTGAVVGSLVLTDYRANLPRIDRLCLNENGEHVFIEGISTDYDPVRPSVPAHLMPLAQIHQTWDGNRRVVNDGVRTVPMNEIEQMHGRMDRLSDLIAQQNLISDISTREAAAKKGVFVDPFLDDTHRDAGEPQTAAVFGGFLTLPIAATPLSLSTDIAVPALCAHNHSTALDQLFITGEMKINPYLSFGVLPGVATLNPAIDRWTEVQAEWDSPVTSTFYRGSGGVMQNITRSREVITVSSTRNLATSLRQISVGFEVAGFGNAELLTSITFDGVDVTPTPLLAANSAGVITGAFTIPSDIPPGSKQVLFEGASHSNASAVFFGEGIVETQLQRELTTVVMTLGGGWGQGNTIVDPLAQTFSLIARQQITGVELFVTAIGTTPIVVQLREVQTGMPTSTVIAEAQHAPSELTVNTYNRWLFDLPIDLPADTQYAIVVLCNDEVGEIGIAELGKFDQYQQRWVTSQPYQVGVLLSSSNATTWTPHQDRDMAFKLLSAEFTETQRDIDLGTVTVENATDLITLVPSIQPGTGAVCELILTLPDSTLVSASDRQVIRLAAPTTGSINVKARLKSKNKLGAILLPGTQIIAGTLANSATYISRAIDADAAGCNVHIIFDALLPSGATVDVSVGGVGGSATFTPAIQDGLAKPLGDGVFEYQYRLSSVMLARIRTKIELHGSAAARPLIENLRVIVTE